MRRYNPRKGTENASAAAIVAAVAHPDVVAKTVERALQNDGTRERMMLHRP
jgi:hypothetical protein